ncbi:threonine AND proline RICH protein [Mycobacterium sp. SM1]|nr:threonine AND proline RICH protein [Mycobacterium sp. SM1]
MVLAVIATIVIVNGGDSASTTATVMPSPSRTVTAQPRPTSPKAAPPAVLPPETVTTLPPPPTTPPTAETPTAEPTVPPPAVSPPAAPPVNPRTVVYTVTGTKQLLDVVTVIYTDAQGLPHTDFNVALPWNKTVVLNPGVQTRSVVATSLYGRLNCAIIDAEGQTIAASTSNTMIATCTR